MKLIEKRGEGGGKGKRKKALEVSIYSSERIRGERNEKEWENGVGRGEGPSLSEKKDFSFHKGVMVGVIENYAVLSSYLKTTKVEDIAAGARPCNPRFRGSRKLSSFRGRRIHRLTCVGLGGGAKEPGRGTGRGGCLKSLKLRDELLGSRFV